MPRITKRDQQNLVYRMLQETQTVDGASTRRIAESLWPETFPQDPGRLLVKTRNALVVQENHGRVERHGHTQSPYNHARSVNWRITPAGKSWLSSNSPEQIAQQELIEKLRREAADAEYRHRKEILEEARSIYSSETPAQERKEAAKFLRDEGCTLQSIANIFGVTRETIRLDLSPAKQKPSLEEKFSSLADRWFRETMIESSVSVIVENDAYQQIIRMGKPAVPLMLKRLQKQPEHWFYALVTILGKDHAKGEQTVSGAAKAWIAWGLREGLITEAD